MAKKKATRTTVGEPLTPTLLIELGAVRQLAPTRSSFRPDGKWANTYRIWTCHGYRESGNQDVGVLRIERSTGSSSESFSLRAVQKVIQTDGILHVLEAEVNCLDDELGTPTRWRLSSRFTGPDGKDRPGLGVDERAVVKGDRIQIKTAGRTLERKVGSSLTSDWCLFDSVQRLEYGKAADLTFDLLEGLSVVKKDQRLRYGGAGHVDFGGKEVKLHRFTQTGSGILPTEYWVDDRHRLQFVCSMNKAYILDENTERTIGRKIKTLEQTGKP